MEQKQEVVTNQHFTVRVETIIGVHLTVQFMHQRVATKYLLGANNVSVFPKDISTAYSHNVDLNS